MQVHGNIGRRTPAWSHWHSRAVPVAVKCSMQLLPVNCSMQLLAVRQLNCCPTVELLAATIGHSKTRCAATVKLRPYLVTGSAGTSDSYDALRFGNNPPKQSYLVFRPRPHPTSPPTHLVDDGIVGVMVRPLACQAVRQPV